MGEMTVLFLTDAQLRCHWKVQSIRLNLSSSNLENTFDNRAVQCIHSTLFHLEYQEVEIFYITKKYYSSFCDH